jgi:hypothetical protein
MFTSKDSRGNWQTTSSKELGDKRRLNLRTAKNYNGMLVTQATVCKIDGIWETHAMYEDFSKRLEWTQPKRVTAKVVEEQHAKHDLEQIAIEAIAFYKEKEHGKS